MTDYQIRRIERISAAACKAFHDKEPRDSHGLIPGSFAEMAFLTQYDRCAAADAKKAATTRGTPP